MYLSFLYASSEIFGLPTRAPFESCKYKKKSGYVKLRNVVKFMYAQFEGYNNAQQ